MRQYLPGNLQERLKELRYEYGITNSAEVAEAIGINRVTYNRIENGSIKTVNSDLLVKLAGLYGVSTDYILGVTDIREKTMYDIEELGLSVGAAKNLYTKKTDPRVVNELLTNKKFERLTKRLAEYFSNAASEVVMPENLAIDFMDSIIAEMVEKGSLPDNREIRKIRNQIREQKAPTSQIEIDKIRNLFVAVIKEIKDKVQADVREHVKEEIMNPDILEAIKENAFKEVADKSLSDAEKAERMANITVAALGMNSAISQDTLDKLSPGMEIIYRAFAGNDVGDKDS